MARSNGPFLGYRFVLIVTHQKKKKYMVLFLVYGDFVYMWWSAEEDDFGS